MVAITDGDTIKVRCDDQPQVVVRISAIDAPEKSQPWGDRSKQSLAALCFKKRATLRPVATDRYGRTVADVECAGEDVGQHQVRAGMAWVFDRYAKGYGHLYALQSAARHEQLGLWADPSPVPPWDWRHRRRD